MAHAKLLRDIEDMKRRLDEVKLLLEKGDVKSLLQLVTGPVDSKLLSALDLDSVWDDIGDVLAKAMESTGFRIRPGIKAKYEVRYKSEMGLTYQDFSLHFPLVKLEMRTMMIHPTHPANFESLQRDWTNKRRQYGGKPEHEEYLAGLDHQETLFNEYESKLPELTAALAPHGFQFYDQWK